MLNIGSPSRCLARSIVHGQMAVQDEHWKTASDSRRFQFSRIVKRREDEIESLARHGFNTVNGASVDLESVSKAF